jgi:hypothetical protein
MAGLALTVLVLGGPARGEGGCLACHAPMAEGLGPHGEVPCRDCHAGDGAAVTAEAGHEGLIRFPGDLSNADRSCGGCHGDWVAAVRGSLMATAAGVVDTTRRVFGEAPRPGGVADLAHSPADSLLRKLCVRCHLGQPRRRPGLDLDQRGGGCLACHLTAYPQGMHPRLSARIDDGRCFGCHARSSRVALSYAGLAEVDAGSADGVARLPDGRLVQRLAADVHHRAGMSCIDCHTARGLKGGEGARHAREAVDIACADCHRVEAGGPGEGAVTRSGTRLTHLERRGDGWLLHPKVNGGVLRVPPMKAASHPLAAEHARLTCDACHSRWAPQCYGCHIRYAPGGRQWDHLAERATPGRWRERRWAAGAGLPALGVDPRGRIAPFVPGMILSVDHPDLEQTGLRRLFAPIAPHTVGASRSCRSCHCDPAALGLGRGRFEGVGAERRFVPSAPLRADGLPEDAWVGPDMQGEATLPGARPLSAETVARVLAACPG